MKKIYKVIPLFLTVFALYTGCRRQGNDIVSNNVDNITNSITNEASASVLEEEKTVQEIIENYGYTAPDLDRTSRGSFAFQIEGNFTGSGNKEIVAFYDTPLSDALTAAICFVLDMNEEKIEKIYNVNWWGTLAPERDEVETVPGIIGSVGRHIMWGDRKIGYVGDFNGNGKEEFYLLSISGMNRQPYFIEFDETGFVRLLDLPTANIFIDSVDIQEKLLTVRILGERYISDRVPSIEIIDRNTYIWNNDTRRYVLLTTERKEYSWNIDTLQYEEIVD
jgi:hypothetical protein